MAGRQSPSIIEGLRGPRQQRMDAERNAAPQIEPGLPESLIKRENATVYQSKYTRLRVSIDVEDDVRSNTGKILKAGKNINVQFVDGLYVNDHKNPETRELIDSVLQADKTFGRKDKKGKIQGGAHFWLATDAEESRKVAQLEAAKNTLAALPREQVEAFLSELKHGTAVDHELPSRA